MARLEERGVEGGGLDAGAIEKASQNGTAAEAAIAKNVYGSTQNVKKF
jgi:hypothetical protein